MGRLIDANELKKAIISQIVLGGTMAKAVDRYLHLVDIQPTAFDVDKVVKQLEEDKRHTFDGCINKKKAIEIVKGGGLEWED